jgi:hypothetical protein
MGPVGLLGGDRQPTRHQGRLVAAASEPAKHAGGLAIGGLLVGGQGLHRRRTSGPGLTVAREIRLVVGGPARG